MLVKCKFNTPQSISGDEKLVNLIKTDYHVDQLALTVGKIYVVYAIAYWNSPYPRFYVCDNNYNSISYPMPYLSAFFEAINSRIPKYWFFNILEEESKIYTLLSFKNWVEDKSFYENLIDGKAEEVEIFQKYKEKIDKEAFEK